MQDVMTYKKHYKVLNIIKIKDDKAKQFKEEFLKLNSSDQ